MLNVLSEEQIVCAMLEKLLATPSSVLAIPPAPPAGGSLYHLLRQQGACGATECSVGRQLGRRLETERTSVWWQAVSTERNNKTSWPIMFWWLLHSLIVPLVAKTFPVNVAFTYICQRYMSKVLPVEKPAALVNSALIVLSVADSSPVITFVLFYVSTQRTLRIRTNHLIKQSRLIWFWHVQRKVDNDWVKRCITWEVEGIRQRGRLKKTWLDCVKNDMDSLCLSQKNA